MSILHGTAPLPPPPPTETHELRVVETITFGRRRPRFHAHCTCGRWTSKGRDCRRCLEEAHRDHVETLHLWDGSA